MNIVKINEDKKIEILSEQSEKLLELGFYADEFVFTFYTLNSIEITKQDNENFYNSLDCILNSDYVFGNKFSMKKNNKIIWFSDQACDLENEYETDMVNRLILKKENDKISLSVFNPFFDRNEIKRSSFMIAFSSGGNGQYSKNLMTGSTFQDDIVLAYQSVINSNGVLLKKRK